MVSRERPCRSATFSNTRFAEWGVIKTIWKRVRLLLAMPTELLDFHHTTNQSESVLVSLLACLLWLLLEPNKPKKTWQDDLIRPTFLPSGQKHRSLMQPKNSCFHHVPTSYKSCMPSLNPKQPKVSPIEHVKASLAKFIMNQTKAKSLIHHHRKPSCHTYRQGIRSLHVQIFLICRSDGEEAKSIPQVSLRLFWIEW